MKTLFDILSLKRPHGGVNERYVAETLLANHLEGLEVFEDPSKKVMAYLYTTDPTSRTLFCAHLDTVHGEEKTPNILFYDEVKKQVFTTGKDCLGADCGAGVWLLLKMALEGVPGTYVWTVGEEKGGVGAKWLADYSEEFLGEFDRAIAFDRRGTNSVITHQGWGGRCCSDVFAETLAKGLSCDKYPFSPDPSGIYTDTAEWTTIIAECTNISIGYANEHSPSETLDIAFLESLLEKCKVLDWERLPAVRDPSVIESNWDTGGFGGAAGISFEDLYGLSEREISELVWTEPDAIAAMLYRTANGYEEAEEELVELDFYSERKSVNAMFFM